MTDKMREEFEAWYATHDVLHDFMRSSVNEDEYLFDDEREAWEVWKASRAAVVIEIPSGIDQENMIYEVEQAGLRVKT